MTAILPEQERAEPDVRARESRPMKRYIGSLIAATALILGAAGGFLVGRATAPEKTVTAPGTATTATVTATTGTVTVVIDGLDGSVGLRLAAVLYRGTPGIAGGSDAVDGLGAFVVPVDTSPFAVADMIRQQGPQQLYGTTDRQPRVAQVPAGTHSVVIYVSGDLTPYSEWVPGAPAERWCHASISVKPAENVVLHVRGVQPAADLRTSTVAPLCVVPN